MGSPFRVEPAVSSRPVFEPVVSIIVNNSPPSRIDDNGREISFDYGRSFNGVPGQQVCITIYRCLRETFAEVGPPALANRSWTLSWLSLAAELKPRNIGGGLQPHTRDFWSLSFPVVTVFFLVDSVKRLAAPSG